MKTPAQETHDRHVSNLKEKYRLGCKTSDIKDYIEGVERAEGKFCAKWLRDDFGAWWKDQQKEKA